jgi:hypothetical protein
MKKIIITCGLLTTISVISFGQSNQHATSAHPNAAASTAPPPPVPPPPPPGEPSPQQMAQQRAKMVQEQYKLSNDQYNGIFKAELDFFSKERELRSSGEPMGQDKIIQMVSARDEKYKQVMNKEQFAKYDQTRPKLAPDRKAAH